MNEIQSPSSGQVSAALVGALADHAKETGNQVDVRDSTKLLQLGIDSLDAADISERCRENLAAAGVALTPQQVNEIGYCMDDAAANDWTVARLSTHIARELGRIASAESEAEQAQ